MKNLINIENITQLEIYEKDLMTDTFFIPYSELKIFGFVIYKKDAHWDSYGDKINFPEHLGYIVDVGDRKIAYRWPYIKIELSSDSTIKKRFKSIEELYLWLDKNIPKWKELVEI